MPREDEGSTMDEHSADDDLRALRGADPAAGVDASAALRDRIASIPAEDAPAGETLDAGTPAGESFDADALAAPVPIRRRRRWALPVAAAAAVVAAIGAGYTWGSGGVDLGPQPVPLAVATGTPDDPAEPIGLGGSGGGAEAELQSGVAEGVPGSHLSTGLEIWPGPGSRSDGRRFIVPAFEDTPGHANVYAVDGRAQYSAEDAARMAAALGIEGEPRREEPGTGGGWVVGEYTGAYLTLSPWSGDAHYGSGIPEAVTVCERRADALHGRDKMNDDGTWAFGQEMIRCMADTPMPSDELVDESVSTFLAAIGFDEDAAELTQTPDESGRSVMVTAARIVENNVTDIVAHITVSAGGIMYASGPTGQVVSLGEYPIVSPAEAAARLNDPAFAPTLVSWPESDSEPPVVTEPTEPPELPEPGSAVPWQIAEHEIVSARLGLSLLYGADGVQYLAPAYEFTASDDTVWSVIALPEDQLDTASSGIGFGVGWW